VNETRAKIKQAEENIRLMEEQLADKDAAKERIAELTHQIAEAEEAKKALK